MAIVSIIVPVYKVEDYLRRCLDSIVTQTLSDIEIILVDDGSPDRCGEICDEYAEKDSRIQVIHKVNGGLSDARNAGLSVASGDYITLVDSDDWIEPTMLEQLYKMSRKFNADIVECAVKNIFPDHVDEGVQGITEEVVGDNIFALKELLKWRTFTTIACAKLYKRSLFQSISYPVGRRHEDEFVTYKLFYFSRCSAYIDEALYNYDRTREGSITQNFQEKNLDVCDAYKERLEFYQQENLTELIPEMTNHYFWVILDKLHRCYENSIYTMRVKNLIATIRENFLYNMSLDIPIEYKEELAILQNSFALFGKSHNNRRIQEAILKALYRTGWGEEWHIGLKNAMVGQMPEQEKNAELDLFQNKNLYLMGFVKLIQDSEQVVLYGAGNVAKIVYNFIQEQGLGDKVICFAVSNTQGKKETIYGKPLIQIDSCNFDKNKILVILAAREIYQKEMLDRLKMLDFKNILIVDTLLEQMTYKVTSCETPNIKNRKYLGIEGE